MPTSHPSPPTSRPDRGFTLIELLVVIIILGVLAAVAVPAFLNQRSKAATASVKADLRAAAHAMETTYADTGAYPGSLPGEVRTSPGVTLTVAGGLTSDEQRFLDFVALCRQRAYCDYPLGPGWGSNKDGLQWVTARASNAAPPGASIDTRVAEDIGWTGPIPRIPTRVVSANTARVGSYCLTGAHAQVPGQTWRYDSAAGGLAAGTC